MPPKLPQPSASCGQAHCCDCESAVSSLRSSHRSWKYAQVDQPAEHLDRRALRADTRAADHALDDDEVARRARRRCARPTRSGARRAGRAPRARGRGRIDLDQREPGRLARRVERVAERGVALVQTRGSRASRSRCRGRAPCAPPGTPTATGARACRAPSVTSFRQSFARRSSRIAAAEVAGRDQPRRLLDLVRGELEPELRRLVHRLEEQLVAVHPLVGASSAARAARRCGGSARSRSRPRRAGAASRTRSSVTASSRSRRRSSAAGRASGTPPSGGHEPRVLHVEARRPSGRDRVRVHREDHVLERSSVSSPSPIFGNSIIVIPIEWPVTWPSVKPRSTKPFETARVHVVRGRAVVQRARAPRRSTPRRPPSSAATRRSARPGRSRARPRPSGRPTPATSSDGSTMSVAPNGREPGDLELRQRGAVLARRAPCPSSCGRSPARRSSSSHGASISRSVLARRELLEEHPEALGVDAHALAHRLELEARSSRRARGRTRRPTRRARRAVSSAVKSRTGHHVVEPEDADALAAHAVGEPLAGAVDEHLLVDPRRPVLARRRSPRAGRRSPGRPRAAAARRRSGARSRSRTCR